MNYKFQSTSDSDGIKLEATESTVLESRDFIVEFLEIAKPTNKKIEVGSFFPGFKFMKYVFSI